MQHYSDRLYRKHLFQWLLNDKFKYVLELIIECCVKVGQLPGGNTTQNLELAIPLSLGRSLIKAVGALKFSLSLHGDDLHAACKYALSKE